LEGDNRLGMRNKGYDCFDSKIKCTDKRQYLKLPSVLHSR